MAVQCEDVGCGGFRPSHLTLVDNHIVSRKKNQKTNTFLVVLSTRSLTLARALAALGNEDG